MHPCSVCCVCYYWQFATQTSHSYKLFLGKWSNSSLSHFFSQVLLWAVRGGCQEQDWGGVAGRESSKQVKYLNLFSLYSKLSMSFSIFCFPIVFLSVAQCLSVWPSVCLSHRYLLYNKPTKVLSPEYLWSDYDKKPEDIRVIRVSQLVKNYTEVRPNNGQWSQGRLWIIPLLMFFY